MFYYSKQAKYATSGTILAQCNRMLLILMVNLITHIIADVPLDVRFGQYQRG